MKYTCEPSPELIVKLEGERRILLKTYFDVLRQEFFLRDKLAHINTLLWGSRSGVV